MMNSILTTMEILWIVPKGKTRENNCGEISMVLLDLNHKFILQVSVT